MIKTSNFSYEKLHELLSRLKDGNDEAVLMTEKGEEEFREAVSSKEDRFLLVAPVPVSLVVLVVPDNFSDPAVQCPVNSNQIRDI